METPTRENSEPMGNCKDSMVSDVSNDGNFEEKPEQNEGEIKGILEVIASTGKYWHCWDRLKSMLSLQLKQIIAKYPEAQMTTEQQNLSLGETCQELARRFDEALLCFDEGPPFTLQRLCEILLTARSIYPKLSKLAFALEKQVAAGGCLMAGGGSFGSCGCLVASGGSLVALVIWYGPVAAGGCLVAGDGSLLAGCVYPGGCWWCSILIISVLIFLYAMRRIFIFFFYTSFLIICF